jgi:hypothetical protein
MNLMSSEEIRRLLVTVMWGMLDHMLTRKTCLEMEKAFVGFVFATLFTSAPYKQRASQPGSETASI